jgi:hypothetical protein
LTPKTKQSNKNNNNPKTKATATDQRNKILYNKSFAAAAAAAVLFPFATTHSCTTHQSFPSQQQKKSSRSKQANLLTYLLTYFCSNKSLHTYLNDNKEKMKK